MIENLLWNMQGFKNKADFNRHMHLCMEAKEDKCPVCQKGVREDIQGGLRCDNFSLDYEKTGRCYWHRYKNGLNYWSKQNEIMKVLAKENNIDLSNIR